MSRKQDPERVDGPGGGARLDWRRASPAPRQAHPHKEEPQGQTPLQHSGEQLSGAISTQRARATLDKARHATQRHAHKDRIHARRGASTQRARATLRQARHATHGARSGQDQRHRTRAPRSFWDDRHRAAPKTQTLFRISYTSYSRNTGLLLSDGGALHRHTEASAAQGPQPTTRTPALRQGRDLTENTTITPQRKPQQATQCPHAQGASTARPTQHGASVS